MKKPKRVILGEGTLTFPKACVSDGADLSYLRLLSAQWKAVSPTLRAYKAAAGQRIKLVAELLPTTKERGERG